MSLRTLSLIITLIFVTTGLVFLALSSNPNLPSLTPPKSIPTITPSPAQTTLRFEDPSQATASSQKSKYSLPLRISTGKNLVTAVQLELSYDPKLLTNISIQKGPFFENPVVLLNNIDPATGRISFALGINPEDKAVNGENIVATLIFETKSKTPQATTISFLPKTLVTAEEFPQSVLKSTVPAEFIVGENVRYTNQ